MKEIDFRTIGSLLFRGTLALVAYLVLVLAFIQLDQLKLDLPSAFDVGKAVVANFLFWVLFFFHREKQVNQKLEDIEKKLDDVLDKSQKVEETVEATIPESKKKKLEKKKNKIGDLL